MVKVTSASRSLSLVSATILSRELGICSRNCRVLIRSLVPGQVAVVEPGVLRPETFGLYMSLSDHNHRTRTITTCRESRFRPSFRAEPGFVAGTSDPGFREGPGP